MKGISPLVATVLLIAITMTIAGMLAYWASSFVMTRTEEVEESECVRAFFTIYSCKYDNGNLNFVLKNDRYVELKNLTAYVLYPNATVFNYTLNETLPALVMKSFNVSGVSLDFSSLVVRTHCANVVQAVSADRCR
jgi:flagellin-like protein